MIRRSLTLKGKDVKWLAKRMKVSHQTIYNWDSLKVIPKPYNLLSLAKILDIPPIEAMDYFYYKAKDRL
jgi:transcriptional regulator with XRE-family HTH domain